MSTLSKRIRLAVVIIIAAIFTLGCAATTGKSAKSYEENYRFVPSVHVEDNSFGPGTTQEFWGCSYDQYYAGYWCPK